MGVIKVVIDDVQEQQFRRAAMKRFGYVKGAMSKAATAAFKQWEGSDEWLEREAEKIGDPLEPLKGVLKHVKKSSVELQHEVGRILAEKYARHRR